MRQARTAKSLREEAAKLARSIPKMKSKKARFNAGKKVSVLIYRAKNIETGMTGAQRKALAKKASKTTTANPSQGLLPNFTSEVNATTAEIARDLVWEVLKSQIAVEVESIRKLLKKV